MATQGSGGLRYGGRALSSLCALVITACTSAATAPSDAHQTKVEALSGSVGVFTYRPIAGGALRVETAMTASFQANARNDCTTVENGLCTRRDCARGHGDPTEHVDAGRITATSGGRMLAVEPEAQGPYSVTFGEGALWEANSPITIEAEGGNLPGFRVELDGPNHVLVTEPALPRATTLAIDREAPFELEWESELDGNVVAILSSQTDTAQVTITCNYALEHNAGFIPSDLFADLDPNDVTMRLNVGVLHSQVIDAGGRFIEVAAFASGMTRDGFDASYSLRFR